MRHILPIVLFFILLPAAVFLLRSKTDNQTTAALQFTQANTVANPGTPAPTQAAIQGPQVPQQPLKIQQIAPVKYAMRSLKQDVIEIGTERHSPASPYQVKPAPSNKPISIMGLPFIKIAEASQGGPPKPYLKLNKWEGEAMLKVSIPYNTTETPEELDGKLRYQGNGVKVDFYPKTPQEITEKDSQGKEHKFTINEEGGVEFDTILDEKPSTNQIVFPIETQNLDFFYQPPLNEENKDPKLACTATECKDKDGNIINFRPENVVGSYAVYYKDGRSGDYSKMGGKNYKAGKAFHIYRPKIWDSAGRTTWGSLSVILANEVRPESFQKDSGVSFDSAQDPQNDTLTIIIPQEFLDSAVYPVTIDPNFGYETAGTAGYFYWTDGFGGSVFTITEDGTASSITASVSMFGSPLAKSAIYKHSDSSLVSNGVTEEKTISTAAQHWETFNFSGTSPSLTASTEYVLVTWGQYQKFVKEYRLWYDSGDTDQGHYTTGLTYGNPFPDPASFTHNNNKYSIYATYTASATPTPAPQTDFSGVNMQGVNIN